MPPTARLSLSAVLALAVFAASPPGGADAQPAPPDATPPVGSADPPARVGRLAKLTGTVSFRSAPAEQWDAATLNDPIAAGMSLWTEPQSEAVVEVSGARIVLAPATELDSDSLDARTVEMTEPQGETCLLVQSLAEEGSIVVRTPRGAVTIRGPGRYGIAAGDTASPTRVAVLAGAAEVQGTGVNLRLATGQTGLISGTDTFQSAVAAVGADDFLRTACAPARPARAVASLPPVLAQMPGGEDLAQYGVWQPSAEYGSVWYPQVPAGWVPYREGHWAYVAPWGWTWIDSSPWGFAPFHYGRWAEFDGRWGWVPAPFGAEEREPPVYAPALVDFIDPGPAFAAGLAAGAGAALAVGWLPLGPREPYRPWYHATDGYVRQVNLRQVQSVTNINSVTNTTVNNYVNRAAATAVPASVMGGSRPVAAAARSIPPAALASAQAVVGRMPLQPTAETAGVTRATAASLHLSTTGAGTRRPAPGPAVAARTAPGAPVALRGPAEHTVSSGSLPGTVPSASERNALPPLLGPGERARALGRQGAPGPALVPHGPPAPAAQTPAVSAVQPPSGIGHDPEAPAAHPAPISPPPGVLAPVPHTAAAPARPLRAPPAASPGAVPQAIHVPQVTHAAPPQPAAHPAPPPVEHPTSLPVARAAPPPTARVPSPPVRPPQMPQAVAHAAPPPVHAAAPPVRPPPAPAGHPGEKRPPP